MNKIKWWFEIAQVTSKKSPDAETKVGAILININTGAVIASGFNGFVRGALDGTLPNTRPEKYKYIVHAEQNLICNCARHGISMDNCILVATLSPCIHCMRFLWQCGIKQILCLKLYNDFEDIKNMSDLDVHLEEVQQDDLFFYKINYGSKDPNYKDDRAYV